MLVCRCRTVMDGPCQSIFAGLRRPFGFLCHVIIVQVQCDWSMEIICFFVIKTNQSWFVKSLPHLIAGLVHPIAEATLHYCLIISLKLLFIILFIYFLYKKFVTYYIVTISARLGC